MSKHIFLFFTFILIFSFIPTFTSEEQNATELPESQSQNNSEALNETESEPIIEPEPDPFDNYNFSNIINLGDSNFTAELAKYDKVFVLFYAPWCGHCHEFIPKYIETSEYMKENDPSVKFVRIDGSKHENSTVEFQVNGFPGIYFVYKGEKHPFKGPRDKEGLLYFMKKKMAGDIFTIKKLEELKNFKNIYNSSLILLSTVINKEAEISKSFKLFAQQIMYIDFVWCISDECEKKYGEDIILFKEYDEKENRYFSSYGRLEDAKNDSVKNFTSIYAVETGAFAEQQNINLAFEFEKQTVYYIRNTTEDAKYDYIFKELGKELRPDNIYTYVLTGDANKIQSIIYQAFSITPDEMPGIYYYDPYTNDPINKVKLFSIRHADMKKVNVDYVKQFIKDIKAGKIKKDLYSELPSDKKDIRGMTYVIGKTFDKEISEEKDNVFLGMIDGYGTDTELMLLDVLGNLTLKYKDDKEKRLKFKIMNINNNEPRDIDANNYDFPRVYLFTNALEKRETIRFTPKNMSELYIEEFESFLSEKLGWKNDTTTEKKEEVIKEVKKEVKKDDKKPENEDL